MDKTINKIILDVTGKDEIALICKYSNSATQHYLMKDVKVHQYFRVLTFFVITRNYHTQMFINRNAYLSFG